jgi:hypothetical protein
LAQFYLRECESEGLPEHRKAHSKPEDSNDLDNLNQLGDHIKPVAKNGELDGVDEIGDMGRISEFEDTDYITSLNDHKITVKINHWLLGKLRTGELERMAYASFLPSGEFLDWASKRWRDIWFTDECALQEESIVPRFSEQ